ncbi:hypothetical protein [Mariniflexile sp.]|uniref:hypothetical protein n=1 Tax=Mariniflexile sp. TaxID=1979402 RepID=UPI003562AC1F
MFFVIQFGLDRLLDNRFACNNIWYKIYHASLNTDIAILGNSRAQAHYNPEVITGATHLDSYNLGVSGTTLNILKIRWQSYINRNKLPKILIIDVDYNLLGTANTFFEKLQYLPYVNEEEYTNVAKQLDKNYLLEKYVPLYKYRGFEMGVYSQIKSLVKADCSNYINGFIINENKWDEQDWDTFETKRLNETVDAKYFNTMYENGVEELRTILKFFNKNNIQVHLIWSPQYYKVHAFKINQRQYVDSLLTKIAKDYKVNYVNFSNDSLVYSKANFYNHSHLNKHGADLFSKK